RVVVRRESALRGRARARVRGGLGRAGALRESAARRPGDELAVLRARIGARKAGSAAAPSAPRLLPPYEEAIPPFGACRAGERSDPALADHPSTDFRI